MTQTVAPSVPTQGRSVFSAIHDEAFKHRFQVTLEVECLAGGVPFNEKVAEGWLRSKMKLEGDALTEQLERTKKERGVTEEEALQIVNEMNNLNGFKRMRCASCPDEGHLCDSDKHQLYIEGRQLKAAIKEATSIAIAGDRLQKQGWGKTNKGLLSFLVEHVFVVENRLPLWTPGPGETIVPVFQPSGITQRFVHTWKGDGIQHEENVEPAIIQATVITDYDFSDMEWGQIWVSGQMNGIGASRSQGYGRYVVTQWDRLK